MGLGKGQRAWFEPGSGSHAPGIATWTCMPSMLPLGSTCVARLCLLLRLSLARSPHALHSVMPHRHLGVSVAPHE